MNARNSTAEIVQGVQVAEGGGTPVWNGFQAESVSLGSTTRLPFSSTMSSSSETATPSMAMASGAISRITIPRTFSVAFFLLVALFF